RRRTRGLGRDVALQRGYADPAAVSGGRQRAAGERARATRDRDGYRLVASCWVPSVPSSWQGVAEQVWLMTLTSLSDSKRQNPTPAFDMIVFGGTGDLAMRKLMPSLMHRDIGGRLHPASRIVSIGRSPIGNEGFAKRVEESCRNVIGPAFTE